MIDRRTFLALLGGAAAGIALDRSLFNFEPILPKPFSMNCKVYTTGREARRFTGSSNIFNRLSSVVTEIDFKTGKTRHKVVPVGEAHNVFAIKNKDKMLVVPQNFNRAQLLDMDMQDVAPIIAPEGYLFGGHGIVLPHKNVVLASLYKSGSGPDLEGIIIAYDLDSFSEAGRYPSGGVRPHDMALFADGKRIALAHSGNAKYAGMDAANLSNELYADRPAEFYKPKLTIFDSERMQPIESMPLEGTIPMIHLAVGHDDHVYAVLQHYLRQADGKNNGVILSDIASTFGEELPFALNELEIMERGEGIAVPLPLMHFDTKSKTIEKIFTSAREQRRSQSIIYHAQTQMIIAAYVFSQHLVCVSEKHGVQTLDTTRFGIKYPIGLCELAGTPYFAVAGMYDDIAILDATTMQHVHSFRAPLYRSSHLTPIYDI